MQQNSRTLVGLAALALPLALLPACKQAASAPEPVAAGAQPPAADRSKAAAEVPVQEDFEDSAEREINAESVEQELAELERELAADSAE